MRFNKIDILRANCRESLEEFIKTFWKVVVPEDPLIWNWHMTVMCSELQACYERVFVRVKREHDLITNVSTGSSKSLVHSVFAPAWAWTRRPDLCVIGACYAEDLALNLSRLGRDVVKSDLYRTCFPDIELRSDQDTKHFYANKSGGFRFAVGSNGGVHGMHGHVIVLDDPINPNEVVSEAEVARTNRWIRHTLSGRKKDKRIAFTDLVMQRLHQNDPTAERLKMGRVRHIRIPATTEFPINPPELVNYYTDGLMDPVRLPQDVLDHERIVLGEDGYAAQYGQSPIPAGGGMFKTHMLQWGPTPPKWKRLVRSWDKAATLDKGKENQLRGPAYSVGTLMGLDNHNRVWLLDVIRVRLDSFSRERLIRNTAHNDGKGVTVVIEEEGGSGGKESAESTVRRLLGFRVVRVKATGAKEVRADEFSVAVNSGNVWIPQEWKTDGGWCGWPEVWVEEAKHFPHSTYKDQIDSASHGYAQLIKGTTRIGGLTPSAKFQDQQETVLVF